MNKFVLAAALGAAALAGGTAEAKKWSLWVQCDGYAKPEPGAAKFVKGLAAIGTLGLFGIPEVHNPQGRAVGAAGVDACRAALADPATAAGPWLRRVTLNQALAIHHLEAADAAAALAALDAASAAAVDNAANPFFARSTGVSLDLLRSVALVRLGRLEDAAAAARKAAAARPYSARVQALALALMSFDPRSGAEEAALADRAMALDPSLSEAASGIYLRTGRYREAWEHMRRQYESDRPASGLQGVAGLAQGRMSKALVAAFTAARAGEIEAGRKILDEQAAEMKQAAAALQKMRLQVGKEGETVEQALTRPVEMWRPMVEAAGLYAAGDAAGAQEKLVAATEWSASTLLVDLAADIRAKLPPEQRKGLVAIEPAELRAKIEGSRDSKLEKLTGGELFALLPEPEDERRLNSFSRQAGWGLKPTGFKHKKLDNGRTRVEFVGSSSSALAVEEMTLLRAAALAREAGSRGFVIERRADYTRWNQATYNGSPVGPRIMAGYKTELEVRFVDDPAPLGHDEAAVHAALANIYIRPAKPR